MQRTGCNNDLPSGIDDPTIRRSARSKLHPLILGSEVAVMTNLNASDSQVICSWIGISSKKLSRWSTAGRRIAQRRRSRARSKSKPVRIAARGSFAILITSRIWIGDGRSSTDVLDHNPRHMLTGDDMEVFSVNVGVKVCTACVGSCLVIGVQVSRHKRCAGGGPIVWIELRRNAQIV